MKKVTFKKYFSLLLAAVCLLCSFAFSSVRSDALGTEKNENIYSYYVWENYEASGSKLPFSDTIQNSSVSFVASNSKVRTIDWNVLSETKSLEVQSCDIRWWSLSVYADEIYGCFEFESVSDNYASTMNFCLETQDETTATSGNGGSLVKIMTGSDGRPVLRNYKNKVVAELNNKEKYDIVVVLKRGIQTYDIYINDTPYTDNEMNSPAYCVKGMRIDASAKNTESTFMLDNVGIFSRSKYPQSFSAQEKMNEPKVTFPKYEEQTSTLLFYNDTQVGLSEKIIEENGTFFIPLADFVKVFGGSFTEKNGKISIHAENLDVSAEIGSANGISNGADLSFNTAPKKVGKTVYAPLNMINVLFGMKVWYDETGDMVVISNKEYASDDILRLMNCRFYMNGQPYYEMSFNKFDLAYQIAPDYFGFDSSYPSERFTYTAAENAIKTLSENGFKTIRFFCICGSGDVLADPAKKEVYYKIMDSVFDLLDKYNMQANVDLCLISDQFLAREYVEGIGYVQKTETTTDLVSDPDCESRTVLYNYLEEFIGRYKDRHCVLMWEIQNEGALGADIGQGRAPGYSLLQLGKFYADVAKKIKSIDSKHLISSGDACLRTSQYHLFLATIAGENNDWSTDTAEMRLKALQLLDYGIDVISAHTYSWGQEGSGSECIDENGNRILMDYTYLMNETKRLGKGYYSGEFSGTLPTTDMNIRKSEIAQYQAAYLDSVIEQGVQLSHWWTFESNRQGFDDDNTWNCSIAKHKFTFDVIVAANKKLQEKYVVNGAAADNTSEATSELAVDSSYSPSDKKSAGKTVIIAIVAVAFIAAAVIILFLLKCKKKSK